MASRPSFAGRDPRGDDVIDRLALPTSRIKTTAAMSALATGRRSSAQRRGARDRPGGRCPFNGGDPKSTPLGMRLTVALPTETRAPN